MASCHSAKIKQDGIIYRSTTSLSGHEIARLILSRLRETFESYRSIGAFAISWRILGIGTRELAFDTLFIRNVYIYMYIYTSIRICETHRACQTAEWSVKSYLRFFTSGKLFAQQCHSRVDRLHHSVGINVNEEFPFSADESSLINFISPFYGRSSLIDPPIWKLFLAWRRGLPSLFVAPSFY